MKGCLKQCSRAPSPTSDSHHPVKHVAFGADGSEQVEVFFADEWDRTPAEPARNLSYQDILELKEIQRSLPRAIQPADLIGSKPASHYLSTVPIGLLPLLPESVSPMSPTPKSTASSLTFAHNAWRTVRTPTPSSALINQQHPSHLTHLPPARTPLHRPKARFAFLPLLEPTDTSRSRTPSPPPSPERSSSPDNFDPMSHDQSSDPPTPALTNASVDSSPLSRASSRSPSPEPTFLQLPPSCGHGRFCGGKYKSLVPSVKPPSSSVMVKTAMLDEDVDDRLVGSEPWVRDACDYDYRRPGFGASNKPTTTTTGVRPVDIPSPPSTPTKSKKAKKTKEKNVIVINDIEIELDDDADQDNEDEEEENNTPPAKTSSIPHPHPDTNVNISSPTPTRHFLTLAPSPSTTATPAFNLHAPISFKRSPLPNSTPAVASPPTPTKLAACSPPRASMDSARGVLVPSA